MDLDGYMLQFIFMGHCLILRSVDVARVLVKNKNAPVIQLEECFPSKEDVDEFESLWEYKKTLTLSSIGGATVSYTEGHRFEAVRVNNMWKQIKSSEIKTFQFGDEPEVIHVFESGHPGEYFVVHDDPWYPDKTEMLTKEEIEQKFKIKL